MPELTEEETTRRDSIVAGLDQIVSDIESQTVTVESEIAELNRSIESYRDELRALTSLHEEVARRLADDDHDDLAWQVECAADINEPEDIDEVPRIDLCHADAVKEVDTLLAAHAEEVEFA